MSNGLTDTTRDILRKPLTSFTRRGSGGTFRYHKGADVIKRLNEAFGHSWSSEKLEVQTIEDQVLMLVSVTVYSNGDVISHQGYGSADIARGRNDKKAISIGNTYKSAFTNALKKAAEQFGIGLEEEEENSSENTRDTPPPSNSPARKPMTRPTGSSMQPRPPMVSRKPMGSTNAVGNSSSAAAYATKAAMLVPPTTPPTMPSPTPPSVPVAVSTPPVNPPNMVSPVGTGDLINGIQETALLNIVKMKNLKETDVVTGALPQSGKVSFKELLRSEAVEVIKYANVQPQGGV